MEGAELRDGRIWMRGVELYPNLSQATFLDLATEAGLELEKGGHGSYVLPPASLGGRDYIASAYFMGGRLGVVVLTWADPVTRSWADFSAEREQSIARDDARWLASMLPGVGSTTDIFTFPWGSISSGFDKRSGFSSIRLRYA